MKGWASHLLPAQGFPAGIWVANVVYEKPMWRDEFALLMHDDAAFGRRCPSHMRQID